MEAVWIIAYVIVVIVALAFIFLYFRATVTLVPPSQCGTSYGVYSVDSGKSGQILQTCGTSGNQICTFDIITLNDAIAFCDQNADTCAAFYFSEVTRNMSFIDITAATIPTIWGGLYRRKVNPTTLQ